MENNSTFIKNELIFCFQDRHDHCQRIGEEKKLKKRGSPTPQRLKKKRNTKTRYSLVDNFCKSILKPKYDQTCTLLSYNISIAQELQYL